MSKRRKPSLKKRRRRATRQREIAAQRRREAETLEDYANPQPFSWPRNAPVAPPAPPAPPAPALRQTPEPGPVPMSAGEPLDYLGEDKFVTATAIVIAIVWIMLIVFIVFSLAEK